MNGHEVNVVEIKEVFPHTNADSLEIVYIDDWQVIIRKGSFKQGDLAVYIEPDYIVPTDKEDFKFLESNKGKKFHRLKAIRLRGEISYGLLIKAKDHHNLGDNVIEEYGISRYVPQMSKNSMKNIEFVPPEWYPSINTPKFSVNQMKKYSKKLFPDPKEIVQASVKIHGANYRFVYNNDKLYIGTRTRWMLYLDGDGEKQDTIWHRAFTDDMMKISIDNPDVVYYGELYGPGVQSFHYGLDKAKFIMFAAYNSKNDKWLNIDKNDFEAFAPVIYEGPIEDLDYSIAEQDCPVSKDSGDIMEGFVVKPKIERRDKRYGRIVAKIISDRYWEQK